VFFEYYSNEQFENIFDDLKSHYSLLCAEGADEDEGEDDEAQY